MKIVEPSYEIVDIPDGEKALAKIEYLGRIAYKSEDKIDPGEICGLCNGRGIEIWANPFDQSGAAVCPDCSGDGWKRRPSSHRFVKMIMKAERKAKMTVLAEQILEEDSRWADRRRVDTAERLVSNIVDYMRQNPAHESVIEHCSASVKFTNNRGFTHELVRHRLASYTQESTRYCDYNAGKFDGEISVIERKFDIEHRISVRRQPEDIWYEAMERCEKAYKELRDYGIPPEIARDVLPQALKADIGITANFRQWRLIFALRDSLRAHPDMQRAMGPLHKDFGRRVPVVFDEL